MGASSRQPLQVFIVSTNARLHDVLAALIGHSDGVAYCGGAFTVYGALEQVRRGRVDVVVSDSLPRSTGDVLLWRQIRQTGASLLLFAHYANELSVIRAILAGASGHILVQPGRSRALLNSIVRAGNGESLIAEDPFAGFHRGALGAKMRELDEAERRLLDLVVQGKADSEIAAETQVTVAEISSAVARLVSKLA